MNKSTEQIMNDMVATRKKIVALQKQQDEVYDTFLEKSFGNDNKPPYEGFIFDYCYNDIDYFDKIIKKIETDARG